MMVVLVSFFYLLVSALRSSNRRSFEAGRTHRTWEAARTEKPPSGCVSYREAPARSEQARVALGAWTHAAVGLG